MDKRLGQQVVPRGTIRRFTVSGGFNTLLFWLIWEFLMLFSPSLGISNTFAWSIGWFISSISAHFVHRYFTFDGRKDVRHTAIGALSVYAFGLVGSTLTFDSLVILSELPIRLIFLLNVCAWGIFTWGMMKWMVFGYIDESED
ncbi:MAG: GtrA family protein [Euryarchaeota archaeon]